MTWTRCYVGCQVWPLSVKKINSRCLIQFRVFSLCNHLFWQWLVAYSGWSLYPSQATLAYCQLGGPLKTQLNTFFVIKILKFSFGKTRLKISSATCRPFVQVWIWHDDIITWKHFPRYWPFVKGILRSPVDSLNKGQWRGASVSPLICAWTNGWANNWYAGDLKRHLAHYDKTVMDKSLLRWGRLSHICIRLTLVQIMACRLFGAKPLSEPMLTYCQLNTQEQIPRSFIRYSKIFNEDNAFENGVYKLATILSQPQRTKTKAKVCRAE